MVRHVLIYLSFWSLFAGHAAIAAAFSWDGLELGEQGLVATVVDGDTVILESGLKVRLVGIQAPKLPLGRVGFKKWPYGEEAKLALRGLVEGRRVRLYYGGARRDRYGRALAHLRVMDDGLWIQRRLLAVGMARVYSFSDNRALITEMLKVEQVARSLGRGLWSLESYHLLSAESLGKQTHGFQIIEGKVVQAAVVRGRGYLNFGPDWKTDFTISVGPADLRSFAAAGMDFGAYEGRSVRVRGWVRYYNGPMIEVTHPEQIEVIGVGVNTVVPD